MQNLIYFFIAIGLSMDAFSLSLAYGTNKPQKNKIIILSLLVGTFHYFMPYIGSMIGTHINFVVTKSNYIISLVFLIISFEMYKSRNEEKTGTLTNIFSLIIFSFTVSIDSFSVGIALGIQKINLKLAFLIFSIVSSLFTYIGLNIGNYLSTKYGKNAIYFGIIILILLAIKYLLL